MLVLYINRLSKGDTYTNAPSYPIGTVCGCPDGFVWNPEAGCTFPTEQCYPHILCNIDPEENFIQWLGTPGCFIDFLGARGGQEPYESACCPVNFEGYETIYSFDNPESQIVVY